MEKCKTVLLGNDSAVCANSNDELNGNFNASKKYLNGCSVRKIEPLLTIEEHHECNQNGMLTMDLSFLENLDVDNVENEYNNAKSKKPKLENNSYELQKSCPSPDPFLEDYLLSDSWNPLSSADISEFHNEGGKSEVTIKTFTGVEEDKFDIKRTSESYINEGHNANDVQVNHGCNIGKFCELPLKERIKKALLENAHKSSPALNSVEIDGVSKDTLRKVNEKKIKSKYFELGPFYSLPTKVFSLIQKLKGIDKLYAWQEECLSLPAVSERKNLVYSLPTSGGKTLVAEILMLREVLCRKRNVIFVLPYVAIVQEKVRSLSSFGVDLEFLVEEYAAGKGNFPPKKRRRKHVIFIATIEKAHGIVNSLIEEGRLKEIGLVVVDELHLIGERGGRGAVLESFLIKILYSKEDIQIVGMSATIGNLTEISTFLNADIFCQNFRPVELKEYVKIDNGVWAINRDSKSPEEEFQLVRRTNFQYSPKMSIADPDQVGGLVQEVVPSQSCLVFCPTKKNCENVAMLICQVMPSNVLEHKVDEKKSLYKALQSEGNGAVCPVLKKILPFGVAYHHSGLTGDERKLIEEAYAMGTLSCICCTSTLAAGVNLPAKRVILRSPYIGNQFINLSRYKQMIGRAGRAGFDSHGESILICRSTEIDKVRELLQSKMDESISSLNDNDGHGAENLILSCVGLGLASCRNSLQNLFSMSLLHVQSKRLEIKTRDVVDKAVAKLLRVKMLVPSNSALAKNSESNLHLNDKEAKPKSKTIILQNDTKLFVSKLGCAAIKGCVDLSLADQLYKDLRQAQSGLVLLNVLHLLYLVTPYDVITSIKCIPNIYYKAYVELNPHELQTAHVLGITESCIMAVVSGKTPKNVSKHILDRFYVTLLLNDLWKQCSIWQVSQKYETQRGIVQSLMNKAATFASSVLHFCKEFEEFWAFQDLFEKFSKRLSHCCQTELLPLMDLPAVKRGRAIQLYNAGFKNLHSIANSTPEQLVKSIEHMPKKVAQQIIAASKLLLLEKVDSLREEAEDLMEGLVKSK